VLVGRGVQPVVVRDAEFVSDPGFHVQWRRRELQFTILRMDASRPVHLTRREVSRALTSTSLRRDDLLIQR
jgi:hypothetical protein